MVRLSICIPTYNFGAFIGETLDSILPQITPEVEVIVFDGGSQDNTKEEVVRRQLGCQQLTYVRQDYRGGIDRDIDSAVSLAKGDYCWLFSSDDVMQPFAVEMVLRALVSEDDIYICEHELHTMRLELIKAYPPFKLIAPLTRFDFGDISQRVRYFEAASTTEAFFSYLAGPIFSKRLWVDAVVPESFYGTCWIVAGRLLGSLRHNVKIQYLGSALIMKREGNDSFSGGNFARRCKISIQNFNHVVNSIFEKNSFEAKHIRRVLRRDVPLSALLRAKLQAYRSGAGAEDLLLLSRLAREHYSELNLRNKLWLLAYRFSGYCVLKFLELLRGVYMKLRGVGRDV